MQRNIGRESIILGSLVNLHRQQFDPTSLMGFDSIYDHGTAPNGFIDEVAQNYLETILTEFSGRSVNLVAVSVHADGSCLTHALSSSLTSCEMFYDALRAVLVAEMNGAKDWYRKNSDMLVMDDEGFDEKFRECLESAKPTRGKRVAAEYYLGDIHIQALANALKRPILVLSADCTVGCDKPGLLYVPLRFSREEIVRAHDGRMPSPIVLGWQSQSKNHYASIWREKTSALKVLNMFRVFNSVYCIHIVQQALKSLGDDGRALEECFRLFSTHEVAVKVNFITGYDSVTGVQGECKGTASFMRDILTNVRRGLDGQPITAKDGSVVNPFILKTNNSVIKKHICGNALAMTFFSLAGFNREMDSEKGEVLVFTRSKHFGETDRIQLYIEVLSLVVKGLKEQINSKYYCKDAFESNMVHNLGIRSCGVISAILSDGWLKFLYDKLQAEDGAGNYDSDFWMTHIADPCASLSCAMLALYTENIPEARFQWAHHILPILEQLVRVKSRRETSLTIKLVTYNLQAVVFRVTSSLRIFRHLGFEIEEINGYRCIVFTLDSWLDSLSGKIGNVVHFAQELITNNGGVAFPGNASLYDLGTIISLSPEAQNFMRTRYNLETHSDMWKKTTELYGDGPFGEQQIGTCFALGSGDPKRGVDFTIEFRRKLERLINSLPPDESGIKFSKMYSIEKDISEKKATFDNLNPQDRAIVLALAPKNMDQISLICSACLTDNRLSFSSADICIFEPQYNDMRNSAQFTCRNCGESMSLHDSNICRISKATENLYSSFLEGKCWICEATVGGMECAVLNDKILLQCSMCSSPRPYNLATSPVAVDFKYETIEFDEKPMEPKRQKREQDV